METEFLKDQKVYCPVYDLIGEVFEVLDGNGIVVYFKDKIFDPYIKYDCNGKLNSDYAISLRIIE